MGEALAIRPFSCLWFEDVEAEGHFCKQYTARRFRSLDRPFQRIDLVIGLAFVAGVLRVHGASWSGGWALFFLALNAAVDWLWYIWKVDSRPELRARMALMKRMAVNVPVALLSTLWFKGTVASPRSLVRFMILTTGVLGLAFPTFAIPMMTANHLMIQVPTVAFMALYAPQRACSEASVPPSSAPYIVAAWRWLNAMCTGALKNVPTPGVRQSCRDVVVMSTVVLGLCLPSYVLWASEYRARVAFSGGVLPQLTWWMVLAHGLLFVTAVSWLWAVHIGAWQ
ncbi:unnamed protein product [Ostreobium quekettii]|uniref:Uncharacterized protein n=1 Tax=Ostreobium quekettii TaxID=121088 RepID=A0A8S1IT95_9CHLO|nr:unnamed protein product [Ostreobium quekettii]|eukprot:evm.model.scf_3185.1 EVM.evm.TU.scf_3185.1   scf_3185:7123-7968(+)